jgi:hypothetical protein
MENKIIEENIINDIDIEWLDIVNIDTEWRFYIYISIEWIDNM